MYLNSFIRTYIKQSVHTNIEHIGLADSLMPNTISFLEDAKFVRKINQNPNIVAVFVKEKDAMLLRSGIETVIVESPKAMLFSIHDAYWKDNLKYSYHNNKIAPSAMVHESARIAACGVTIGENVVIGANTVILSGVEIGENTTIGPNCVIGADGFHVYDDLDGIKRVAIHDGKVKIGKNVDIHAAVVVDRGLMGRDTVIGDECKLDNMVCISHRAQIGARTIIAGNALIAGSATIGDNVKIASTCVISNRIRIGNNAKALIGAIVIDDVRNGATVSGNFAMPHEKHLIANAKMML